MVSSLSAQTQHTPFKCPSKTKKAAAGEEKKKKEPFSLSSCRAFAGLCSSLLFNTRTHTNAAAPRSKCTVHYFLLLLLAFGMLLPWLWLPWLWLPWLWLLLLWPTPPS